MNFTSNQLIDVNGVSVAANRRVEFYDWDDTSTLKLFFRSVSDSDIDRELAQMVVVKSLGVYVPSFQKEILQDVNSRRKGYILEKSSATSLLSQMEKNPFLYKKCCNVLAALQSDFHKISVGDMLPCQIQSICSRVSTIRFLSVDIRKEIIKLAESLPTGDKLCHSDLTPQTVFCADDRAFANEWRDARRGNPACDVARTALILMSSGMAGTWLDRMYGNLLKRSYLSAYSKIGGIPCSVLEFKKWLRVNAAYRLGDSVSEKEILFLLNLVSHS